jgi:glutaredoxin
MLNMIIRLFIAGLFLLSNMDLNSMAFADINLTLPEKSNGPATQTADIEVFVREGCPHCADAELFLQKLKREQPTLNIVFHDVIHEESSLQQLEGLVKQQGTGAVRVPAFQINGQFIVGYADELTTGQLIRNALSQAQSRKNPDTSRSCGAEPVQSCEAGTQKQAQPPEPYFLDFLGHRLSLDEVGLPVFTLVMGLLDGFNPCSLWVLLLMISLLAPMMDRLRMFAIAGTFVAVEGLAYYVFMTAWLNLFLFIGISRISEIGVAVIAMLAGMINLKDFWFYGRGYSLSIPESAKPGIYARMRRILYAQNLIGALIGAVLLAILVQVVELLCTSGFPALYTRILTLKHLESWSYYGYLLLYNLAYMLDDMILLTLGIITLSQKRLQEREGRWLKLISGVVMVGLGIYLIGTPG